MPLKNDKNNANVLPMVLGQCYHYAQMQQGKGRDYPFVILSTLKETVVCWNSDLQIRI